ncbi:MAG: integrin alpha [Rickettsiales bacterium]
MFPEIFDLKDLDGKNGFAMHGTKSRAGLGFVSAAGDFNNDGVSDLLVTEANTLDPRNGGRGYILFGGDKWYKPHFKLEDVNGTNGFIIDGQNYTYSNGIGLYGSNLQDVNGDNVDDVIFSLTRTNRVGPSTAFVIYGSEDKNFDTYFDFKLLNGTGGIIIQGITNTGSINTRVGDINDDGISDILISEYISALGDYNSATIVYGSKDNFPYAEDGIINLGMDLGEIGARFMLYNGYRISQIPLAGIGDMNGDGIDDALVQGYGEMGVFYGSKNLTSKNIDQLDGKNGFKIEVSGQSPGNPAFFGKVGKGDINADGIDDLIFGNVFNGSAYVIYGSKKPFNSTYYIPEHLDGKNGFSLFHQGGIFSGFGRSVSMIGDINNDGIDDFFVGAINSTVYESMQTTQYIIFGNKKGFPAVMDPDELDGRNGFKITNQTQGDSPGIIYVDGIGDFNNDGIDDFAFGAPGVWYNGDGVSSYVYVDGQAYVIYGQNYSSAETQTEFLV